MRGRAGGGPGEVREVAVVVPARDEEDRIGRCLDAVGAARLRCPVPARVVVVADSCEDRTAEVARGYGVEVVVVGHGCVGLARDAGARLAIGRASAAPDNLWLASTDADSRVPPDWLAFMVRAAGTGVDLVLGTVLPELADERLASAWSATQDLADGHAHVHGANLGVRASTYAAVGGFPPADTGEDVILADRVARRGAGRVLRTGAIPVATSGRLVGRAPSGLAAYLRALEDGHTQGAPVELAG